VRLRSRRVGWLALACVAAIVILLGKPDFTNASQPSRGIASPVVALEVARNVDEVDAVLSDAPSPDREAMRIKQYIDFAFIAFYAALYIALAAMFRSRPAWVAAAVGVVAAGFDVAENLAILHILDVPLRRTTQTTIDAIRYPGLTKWALAFVATGLFGWLFWNRGGWTMRLIGGLNLAAAALGFCGLYDNAFLVWAGWPLLAGLIAATGVFLRFR
jgi:hypothetical protein